VVYTHYQTGATNVYNLVTKRAVANEDATMDGVDCNLGSKITMKYPAVWLIGPARPTVSTVESPFAGKGQAPDAGSKIVHAGARDTSSAGDQQEYQQSMAGRTNLPRIAEGSTRGGQPGKVQRGMRRAHPG